jgi:hypothetical protein
MTAAVKAFFVNLFPTRNLGTEGFLGKTWRAIAMALWTFTKAVQDASRDAVPTDDTSAQGLDDWAETIGLPNGDGGYGRRGPQAATGGVVEGTGTNGTVINDGTQLVASDGVTLFQTVDGPYTITLGVASISVNALTEGAAGNLDAGELLTWISPPAGLDATAEITSALEGGEDEEDDADLLLRVQFRLRNPPKGGVASDYRYWCENAENVTTGESIPIERAYVYPRRSGTGTVDTVITQAGNGTGRKPSSTVQTNVQDYVDTQRPVTVEDADVMLPYMPAAQGMTIVASMDASPAYPFDWDDLAAARPTVIAGGTTTLLRISGSAPTALSNAVTAAGGVASAYPRVLLENTTSGAPVLGEVRRVTAIDAVSISPNTILTLSGALTVYPTAGDTVYAAGPGTEETQEALRDYVDTLGPSRSSGFADPDDVWDTTCAIARLSQTALDTLASDGERYWSNVNSGGVTINGVATDVTPTDSIANGPQLLYAGSILVTS